MIFAESRGMHTYLSAGSFWAAISQNIGVIVVGAALLLVGYLVAARAFQDAWFVAIISLLAVLIVEPAVMYFFFRELPGRGEMIGFFLAVLGMAATFTL